MWEFHARSGARLYSQKVVLEMVGGECRNECYSIRLNNS
jgi:hypothetical protein